MTLFEQLWKKYLEEVPDGCIREARPPDAIPRGKRCVTRRFGKDEGLKPDGSQKIRPIDDYTASWVNAATAPTDRLVLQTLDDALVAARALETALQHPVQIWKADHKGAYRQVPVRTEHLPAMYISIFQPAADGVAPQLRVAQHTAMPFGAVGAVHGYQRLSEARTHCLLYTSDAADE